MDMVVHDKNDRIKQHKFILCNDILVVSSLATSFKSGQLIAVYPLIGLRIAREPKLNETLIQSTDKDKLKYRFALVPQNKNFSPSDTSNSNYVGSIIIICSNEKQLEKWIETIEDTVDEEEHNLKPCNPVDLEKRLRKQKTSKEGTEYFHIHHISIISYPCTQHENYCHYHNQKVPRKLSQSLIHKKSQRYNNGNKQKHLDNHYKKYDHKRHCH